MFIVPKGCVYCYFQHVHNKGQIGGCACFQHVQRKKEFMAVAEGPIAVLICLLFLTSLQVASEPGVDSVNSLLKEVSQFSSQGVSMTHVVVWTRTILYRCQFKIIIILVLTKPNIVQWNWPTLSSTIH